MCVCVCVCMCVCVCVCVCVCACMCVCVCACVCVGGGVYVCHIATCGPLPRPLKPRHTLTHSHTRTLTYLAVDGELVIGEKAVGLVKQKISSDEFLEAPVLALDKPVCPLALCTHGNTDETGWTGLQKSIHLCTKQHKQNAPLS